MQYADEMDLLEMPSVRISVRNLVEFIMRSGDIDNRHKTPGDQSMLEGGRIHRMIQRRMGSDYHAEFFLRYEKDMEDFEIVIEGRADGVIIEGDQVTIDEIKSVYKDLDYIGKPMDVHLAQAKCYAYIYADQNSCQDIRVRMTYCNIETEEIKYFHEAYTYIEIRNWFMNLLAEYAKWARFEFEWKKIRKQSIKALEFPFTYRDGQKELVSQVYRTIYHERKIFIEAPTGVGKTISTVFPAVKAVGEDRGDKIFYLTAKTITRTVASDCFDILRSGGLRYKTVILTAKDKICPCEETECNPDACPRAKGHYDRINDAIYDLLQAEDSFTRESIEEYALKHVVCPFELCLDMSLFSDAVICDYNYVFDPNVYLRRFFGEGVEGNYLFLIDEAHNLVDRAMDMYSAILYKEDIMELRRHIKPYSKKLEKTLDSVNKYMLSLKRECQDMLLLDVYGVGIGVSLSPLLVILTRLVTQMEKFMEDEDRSEIKTPVFDLFLQVRHFINMYENINSEMKNYVAYAEHVEDPVEHTNRFMIKLLCVNPSYNITKCLDKGRSAAFFSATLLPIDYYRNLLSGNDEDYAVYAKSVFDERKRGLFICNDVTSKYSRRSDMEYYNIAKYIHLITGEKQGNYIVFFPSHAFLNQVYHVFQEFFETEQEECIIQKSSMREEEREEFLNRFEGNEDCDLEQLIQMDIEYEAEKTLIGFCVMGGIFSEGIDLKNDRLIGTIIVGTGLPMVCNERELLKDSYDAEGMQGFDYAYRYPGMNKVLQAAGRVIRTAEDVGIVALLDERFLTASYQRMFPREWKNYQVCNLGTIADEVADFWSMM